MGTENPGGLKPGHRITEVVSSGERNMTRTEVTTLDHVKASVKPIRPIRILTTLENISQEITRRHR